MTPNVPESRTGEQCAVCGTTDDTIRLSASGIEVWSCRPHQVSAWMKETASRGYFVDQPRGVVGLPDDPVEIAERLAKLRKKRQQRWP